MNRAVQAGLLDSADAAVDLFISADTDASQLRKSNQFRERKVTRSEQLLRYKRNGTLVEFVGRYTLWQNERATKNNC